MKLIPRVEIMSPGFWNLPIVLFVYLGPRGGDIGPPGFLKFVNLNPRGGNHIPPGFEIF